MDIGLLRDGDYVGVAVAEIKGDIAVDVDGAFVEQGHTQVGAEGQFVDVEVGGFSPVVTVGD